jgi:hypothetical protein
VGRYCISVSSDGLTWTNNGYFPSQYLKSVAYGSGVFVAVGEFGSTILLSPDGASWTSVPSGLGPYEELDEVIYHDSKFMAVGMTGTIITSVNGTNWISVHSPTATNLRSVAAHGSNWVIVGNNEQILQTGASPVTPNFCPLNWIPRHTGVTNTLEDVIYANGRYFAVGQGFARVVSTTGASWTNLPPISPINLQAVAFGNGRYIATGQAGAMATATSDTNWTIFGGGGLWYSSIAYGNGVFVLVGTNMNTLMTTNATNFFQVLRNSSNSLNGVAFGNGRFVAVGRNGTILSAPWPGTNWTVLNPIPPHVHLQDVAFGEGLFVAVGGTNVILVSSDSLNWTQAASSSSAELRSVTYGRGLFAAIGKTAQANDGLLFSSGGYVWNSYPLPKTNQWHDIGYGDGSFLIVGERGMALQNITMPVFTQQPVSWNACVSDAVVLSATAQSSCGVNVQWRRNGVDLSGQTGGLLLIPYILPEHAGLYTIVASNDFGSTVSAPATVNVNPCRAVDYWTNSRVAAQTVYSAACAGDLIVAVGSAGTIAYSSDGSAWTNAVSPISSTLNAVAYGNGVAVAVGASGATARSIDGTNWTAASTGTNRTLNAIAFGANTFVAVGQSGVAITSVDGSSWEIHETGIVRTWAAVTYGNGMFAAAALGVVGVSADGANWELHPTGSGVSMRAIACGNGTWVAVGSGGTILASTNLIQWTAPISPTTVLLYAVAFANGQFVAVGENGEVLSSFDGFNWAVRRTYTAESLRGIAFCGGSFYAVGGNGVALRSSYAGPPVVSASLAGAALSLDVSAELGAPLRIDTRTNLANGSWMEWLSFTNLHPTTRVVDNQVTNVPRKFYRAVAP